MVHTRLQLAIQAFLISASVMDVCMQHGVQGRRNTFKTRGAEDSRYMRGRFASEASEKFFEAN